MDDSIKVPPPFPSGYKYPVESLTAGSFWIHRKGGAYVVIGVSTCSTNGPLDGKEKVVVYWSLTYTALRHRALEEFLDGRFRPATSTDRFTIGGETV